VLRKSATSAFIAGILLAFGAQAAWSAMAASAKNSYGPYAGWSYNNWAEIWNGPMQAATAVETAQGYQAPPGYMGARPRMLNSDGTICHVNQFRYNNIAASGFASFGDTGGCGGYVAWYSHGWSQAWNGYSYETFGTWRSPNLGK